jgi:hypothetical protein
MYCPHCGAQNTDNTAFCGRCGRPFAVVPTQFAGYPEPSQPYPAYPPPPQVPYAQPGYPMPAYWVYGQRPAFNWKFFLPLGGALLAFLSFFLPWFHIGLVNFSVSAYNLAARTGLIGTASSLLSMYGDPTGQINNALGQMGWLWLVPLCALPALLLFLRNNLGKLGTIVGATIGLVFLLIFTISLNQAMDNTMSSITNLISQLSAYSSLVPGMSTGMGQVDLAILSNLLGFGYYLACVGFVLQLAGVFIAWNDIDKRG